MITLYQFEISPFCDKVRRAQGLGLKPYEVVCAEYRASLEALEELVADRPFLCGDRPSGADLSIASMSACVREVPEGAVWASFPKATAWYERVQAVTGPPGK